MAKVSPFGVESSHPSVSQNLASEDLRRLLQRQKKFER